MPDYLGPRVLHYIAPNGHRGDIALTIHHEPDQTMTFADGDALVEVGGSIHIDCDWFTKVIVQHGMDEIQLLFRLLRLADIYVQKICRDNGFQVYQYIPGDVDEDFGIY